MKKISIFILALLFVSCSSIKEPENVYEVPDYTLEDVKKEEIKNIESLLEKNPVQSLWRSIILNDEPTKEKCFESVRKEFDSAIEKENWFFARSLYKSLKNANYSKLSSLSKSENELEKLCTESISGVSKSEISSKKVSSYINGTVTVWVDKGIAVHNGMGYADRVIGSGFFISKNGYIITNHHVISDVVNPKNEKYSKLFIKMASDSDTRIPAKVIGWDDILDLALLKAEVEAPFVFNLGSSSDLDVGDKIFAIGSPVGLERTLTSGIVSATDRKLFTMGSVMQIDAAVNSGNSGGPCIDSNGNVQAVVFAGMLQYEGLNFAIPVEYLKAELSALFSGGKINHAWIGAFGHSKKFMGKNIGLEVQYVMPGGSANRAKIKVGDIITEIDGEKVFSLEDMQNVLLKNTSKSIISLKYKRNIDSDDVQENSTLIYLSTRPENPGYLIYNSDLIANSFIPIYGMKLMSVSSSPLGKRYLIENIINGSIGDEAGFSENDYIEIKNIKFSDEKSVIYSEIYAKNRKKGYLDLSMALPASLDGPYYF